MLIKSADDKSKRLALLEDRQKSGILGVRQKDLLRDELRNLMAGTKGEQAAANQSKTFCVLKECELGDFNCKDTIQSLVRETWIRLQRGALT